MGRHYQLIAAAALAVTSSLAEAQASQPRPTRFFDQIEPVRFTLVVDIKQLRADTADEAPLRNGSVSFRDAAGKASVMPVKVKTHGRWRLLHCEFPPLSITFPDSLTVGTPFEGLSKARLTSFCKDHPAYEQYIIQELQLYRIYQLLTPYGHTPRALQVTYVDAPSGRTRTTRYAFFIDDREAVATRHSAALLKAKGAAGSDLEPYHRTLMGVFEYMIGNTDLSVMVQHNVRLILKQDNRRYPVPYDFDYSGLAEAAYAAVGRGLPITNVRDRLYRGPCRTPAEWQPYLEKVKAAKPQIMAVFETLPGLSPSYRRNAKNYLEEFYRTINSPSTVKRELIDTCIKVGM